jgi:hypothetical protein
MSQVALPAVAIFRTHTSDSASLAASKTYVKQQLALNVHSDQREAAFVMVGVSSVVQLHFIPLISAAPVNSRDGSPCWRWRGRIQ